MMRTFTVVATTLLLASSPARAEHVVDLTVLEARFDAYPQITVKLKASWEKDYGDPTSRNASDYSMRIAENDRALNPSSAQVESVEGNVVVLTLAYTSPIPQSVARQLRVWMNAQGAHNGLEGTVFILQYHLDERSSRPYDLGSPDEDGPAPDNAGEVCAPIIARVHASSQLSGVGKNRYDAPNLLDHRAHTAWVEGVEGPGVGEWVELELQHVLRDHDTSFREGYFWLQNGYQKSATSYAANGRVAVMTVSYNGIPFARVRIPDSHHPQVLSLMPTWPTKLASGDRFRFQIEAVYPGSKYADTAVSALIPLCSP